MCRKWQPLHDIYAIMSRRSSSDKECPFRGKIIAVARSGVVGRHFTCNAFRVVVFEVLS